ncbi:MAG TPA: Hsp20/alpha crystallin family protein [Thermoanaerobaculia bacterium]
MNLIRYEPTTFPFRYEPTFPFFQQMEEMSERLNRLFGTRQRPNGKEYLTVADWAPVVDIQETENEYLVKAELPEVKKEDVKVTIENGVLTLQGERRQEKEEKGKKFHRTERLYGTFLRTFTVPPDAEETRVAADFKDGILRVHLPKAKMPRPKAIEVKVAS